MTKTHLKPYISLLLISLFTLILVACGTTTDKGSTSSSSSAEEVTLTDANGTVTLPLNPKKIVVLDNGMADTIRALGYEERIVGMPVDTLPAYLKDLGDKEGVTNVGNLKNVNLETIAGLEPDLIIASGRTASQVEEFKKIAPTLYFATDSADYWASVKTNITELSKVFGQEGEKKAAEAIESLEKDIDAVAKKNADSDKTTLTVLLNEGSMAGMAPDGRYAVLYQTFGFKPTSLDIKEESRGGRSGNQSGTKDKSEQKSETTDQQKREGGRSHGSSLSFESVSQVNPDIIFVIDRTLAVGGDNSSNSDIFDNALIQETKAAKEKKIVTLTSDLWYLSGGGLESTALMLEEVSPYAGQ